MGVDNPGKGADRNAENVETPPVREKPERPPPDNPGAPGQPSRLESIRAAAARHEALNEQEDEKEDERTLAAETEPAETRDETSVSEEGPAEGPKALPGAEAGESVERSDASEPEVADQDDAWREHADTMKAKWADLKAELNPDRPEEGNDQADPRSEGTNQDPEDLSDDEPGSWRGESGRYLSYEEHYAVGRAFERGQGREPEVSDVLQGGEAEVAGAKLVGFEYRLKGEERFKEKAAEQLAADLRENPRAAAESLPDALRYTYQFSREDYVRGYGEIKDYLERSGYEMMQSRNFWGGSEYKGINSRWRTPDGQLFEVQFHTPESFEAKQLTHGAYELIRNPRTDGRAVERLDDFQREVSAGIPMPEGVLDIPDFRREGY